MAAADRLWGGVSVLPEDMIVIDDDGAVVIRAAFLGEVIAQGMKQEREEAWIMNEVMNGSPLPGLYPMNAQTQARYEAEGGID